LYPIFNREGHIAQGNLVRQPGRASITASTIMISLSILVAMAALTNSILSSTTGFLDKSMGSDYLLMPQSIVLSGGNIGAGPQLVQSVRETPGIAAATTWRLATSKAGGDDVQVVGIDPVTYRKLFGLVFSAGDPDTAYAELDTGRTVIANGIFAAQKGLKMGQDLVLLTSEGPQAYRLVGIGAEYLNAKLATVYISQDNLARDFHVTNDLLIMANRNQDADPTVVRTALEGVVQDYPAFSLFASDEWRQAVERASRANMGVVYVLMVTLTIPSLIALVNTLAINVLERTREIGTLRAVGATRRQVGRMVLAESLLLAATGTAFGLLAGVWLGYVLVAAVDATVLPMPYFFPLAGVLLTIAVGLLLGVLGAMIPARQAARLNIVAALHQE
jgi:putative ABC transport system permease protein